jgi:phosphatidyl-myo-inositol dimannoside synthase
MIVSSRYFVNIAHAIIPRMKVVAIAETEDVRSGWGRYTHEVVSNLAKNGVVVDLIIKGELLPFSWVNFFKNTLIVRKHLTNDVSLVHAFDVWPFGVYAYMANFLKGLPLFITGVGTYSIPPRHGVKAALMRRALNGASEIFCISRYTRELIKKHLLVDNTSIVPWGTAKIPNISEELFSSYASYFSIRVESAPILLTVGQIKHRKGQLDTLKAVKILKEKYSNILYVVVGSTSDTIYVEQIKTFARENGLLENLRIVGNQKDDKELAFFYALADIFVMTSNNDDAHFEGFGLVFLEAAQFGKPAVGSAGCGIEDAILDGETGYLSKQGDEMDIAEKIDKVLANKKDLGDSAKLRASQFTWEKNAEIMRKSYEKYI